MNKLLIAEPAYAVTQSLVDALQEDWEIRVCEDGLAAMDALKAWQPDALIIDLKLPKKDGLTVLAESFPDLPPAIVALGAVVNPSVEQFAARWGVDYLFELPFSPKKIRLALEEAVGQNIPAKRTAQHLRVLGFRAGQDGYFCLITAIPSLYRDPSQKLMDDVYVEVAKRCGMADKRSVEHSIRTAIRSAWERRDPQVWKKYFPVDGDGNMDPPKSKEFIYCLLSRI